MRLFALATALLATGCFHWAPASSLSSIEDDRVQVYEGSHLVALRHATAHGRVIEGEPTEGFSFVEREEGCAPPSCARMDVSRARVLVRKLNLPATIAVVAGSAVIAAATVFLAALVAFALAPKPVFF